MGMNINEQQLLGYLLRYVTGVPIQCDRIRYVDLYGNKKPSELFDTTTTNHYHYVFTRLKKVKAENGNNFSRRFVGGTWTRKAATRPVYNKERSEIGFKRAFRFDENNLAWYMTEYHLSDRILEDLRLRGQIPHEVFVVCRIRCNVITENFAVNSVPISSSQCQETVKSFAQENQDLRQSNVISNGNVIRPVSLVLKESNVTQLQCSVPVAHQETPSVSYVAREEECSVPVVHQENPSVSLPANESNVVAAKEEESSAHPDNDIASYHKKLDAYAASVLETMVPYIPEPPQEDDADSIRLFCEDFYIGYTNLWS